MSVIYLLFINNIINVNIIILHLVLVRFSAFLDLTEMPGC